jgi:hypothetical protein
VKGYSRNRAQARAIMARYSYIKYPGDVTHPAKRSFDEEKRTAKNRRTVTLAQYIDLAMYRANVNVQQQFTDLLRVQCCSLL